MYAAVLITILILTSACATAREIKTIPNKGGVVALYDGLGRSAEEKAKDIMRATCKRGYRILERGEVVIGNSTTQEREEEDQGQPIINFLLGYSADQSKTKTETKTMNFTEFRMKYECRKKDEDLGGMD